MSTQPRARARDLGLSFGPFPPGAHNAITDVPGVRVGHATIVRTGVRTGVTAVVPPADDLLRQPVRAAAFVANGHTKTVGLHQVQELGQLETPILLTGTLSVFRVADVLLRWVLGRPGNENVRTVNPVVGETNDARWGAPPAPLVDEDAVVHALDSAAGGAVAEGCVGAGTGVVAFGFKAGIGTASRVLGGHTVGAIVQSNHAGQLTVAGRVIGEANHASSPGSVIVVVATDAPLDARQLGRLSRRAMYAMARTGSSYAGRSGDVAVSFSTEPAASRARIDDRELEDLWVAVQDTVDEALVNSLTVAESASTADGSVIEAVPLDALRPV